jgi:hypothetical protein
MDKLAVCVLIAEAAGSVGITLLENGVISRIRKSREGVKAGIREGQLYNSYVIVVV